MAAVTPLKIWLEKSTSSTLHKIVSVSTHFHLQVKPESAELILYENDSPEYISKTTEYKKWPGKCVVISETDLPSYFLPACYASNKKCLLGKERSITIPFLLSEFTSANPYIEQNTSDIKERFLYAFKGGSTSWVRKKLFKFNLKKEDVYIQDSSSYHHWDEDDKYKTEKKRQQQEYANLLHNSSFFLCPRGAGASSIRLFEVMRAGKVPVILADNWIPVPEMPWKEFSLFVPENKLNQLDTIIRLQTSNAKAMGLVARQVWEQYCAPEVAASTLATSLQQLMTQVNPKQEKWMKTIYPFFGMTGAIKTTSKAVVKKIVLKILSITGIKFSYSLNRPVDEQLKKNKKV